MPVLTCPRCQRVNPAEAAFCHFDGVSLFQGPVSPVAGALPQEFIFPSKRRCRTLDEFVQGCQYEWEDARELLRRGDLTRFFSSIGRMDLGRAAREAESNPDHDIALVNFLGNLPVQQVQGPRIDLEPRRLLVDQLRPGDTSTVRLRILNTGKGLLQGRITVTEGGSWVWIESADRREDGRSCPIKAAREQEIVLRIDTRGLAAPQSYSARLVVVTNGGIAELPLRMDLGATPFDQAPFAGAATPREMAERMRTNPKAAVPLLESGVIQRWFQLNSWDYPISGVPARGVAAVQQFFEAMGLSKPPPLFLSETQISCLCVPDEVSPYTIQLRTTLKKWVYAQIDSDVPWLKVTTPNVAGAQQASISFEVDASLLDEGASYEGSLRIQGNARQDLFVRVKAEVPVTRKPFTRRLLGPFFAVALLAVCYRLLFAVPGDLLARVLTTTVQEPAPGTLQRWLTPAVEEEGFLRQFVLTTWWVGTVGGAWLVGRKGGRTMDVFCGALAGTMAGVIGSITLACLLTIIDSVPRHVLSMLAEQADISSAWIWTPVWLGCALLWAGLLGIVVALFLRAGGKTGQQLLSGLGRPLSWILHTLGWKQAAKVFTFS